MDQPNQLKNQDEIVSRRGARSGSREGKSYECNFCKRGFSNAQALGGHMNIHRKDKAVRHGKSQHDTSDRKFSTFVDSNSCFPGQFYTAPDNLQTPWRILESSTAWDDSQMGSFRLQDVSGLHLHQHPEIVDEGIPNLDLNLELRLGTGPEYGDKKNKWKNGSKNH